MQKLTVLAIAFVIAGVSMTNAQQTNEKEVKDKYRYGANVRATDGVSWYVFANPLRDYEVLETFELSFRKDYIQSFHLKQVRSVMANKSIRLKKRLGKVDGILTNDGYTMKVIRYKAGKKGHEGIANVQTINGKQIYCWVKPLKLNEKVFELPYNGDLKLDEDFFQMKLENLVSKAKNMAEEKGEEFDALVIRKGQMRAITYNDP